MPQGGATGFVLAWPSMKNYRVWNSIGAGWDMYQIWSDETEASVHERVG